MSLGDRLDRLSPEKRALLEKQLLARRTPGRAGGGGDGLRRRQAGEALLLSFAQQQLWFLDQWQLGGSAYNASLNLRLDGALDEGALLRAFEHIVRRHETLRTVIDDDSGVPKARLLDDVKLAFTELDLTADGALPSSDAVVAAVQDVVSRPFNLSCDIPLRVGLIRLAPDARIICIVVHHIACDGWSRVILFDELAVLYTAYVEGREPFLDKLPVQYGDYAEWQRRWLSGDRLRSEMAFWRGELAGTDMVLDLPTDRRRPDVLTFSGARLGFVIPGPVANALRTLGREERATIFMVVHAVTGCFLHGLTGQEDLLVGSPVANRRWSETEGLIGFFVNTLVLRLRMTGDPALRELVRRSRETLITCYAHQELPFERVVQAARPKRLPDRNPLFQVNLRMQGPAPDPPRLPGLSVDRVSVGLESARFDLALGLVDEPGDLHGYLEFNSALFDEATIAGWTDHLVELFRRAAQDPDLTLSALAEPLRSLTSR